jgi:membrane protein implicated in regulation of membrane protease activity
MKHLPIWKQLTQTNSLSKRDRVAWVESTISANGNGRIRWQGTTWPAYCEQTEVILAKGDRVLVVGIDNLTVLVQPLNAPEMAG